MTALPLAHIGHWWTSLLYLAPVVVVVVWLAIHGWRERHRERTRR